jgi:aldehyde:ferredoxin oxidoreductase
MWGNSRVRRKDFWTEEIAKEWTETMENMQRRLISCYNCPMTCGATIQPPGKPTYMMKCFSKLTYTMAAFSDLEFGLGIAQSATEYGVDGFSTPQVMAFALELLEAEESTRKPLGWGPYVIEEWEAGESITLVKNRFYFREALETVNQGLGTD